MFTHVKWVFNICNWRQPGNVHPSANANSVCRNQPPAELPRYQKIGGLQGFETPPPV